jgi:hypothetical protein
VHGRRKALDEGDQRAVDPLVGYGLQVVEDEHHAPRQGAELVDQQRDHDLLDARPMRAQRAFGGIADPRHCEAQRFDDARPEADRIVVALV